LLLVTAGFLVNFATCDHLTAKVLASANPVGPSWIFQENHVERGHNQAPSPQRPKASSESAASHPTEDPLNSLKKRNGTEGIRGLDPDLEPLGNPFRSVFGILVGLQTESKLGRRLVS
jgi:hypothetical protein